MRPWLRSRLATERGRGRATTAHSAKGLEWPVVYAVVGERHVPSPRSDPEEERRLAYVIVTRAMDKLFVAARTNACKNSARAKPFPGRDQRHAKDRA